MMDPNGLKHLKRCLTALRDLDPDMPMAQALSLIIISESEGLSLKELADKAGVGMASASRYVAFFGKPSPTGRKGLGLVVAVEDPLERRKKTITLTGKGRAIINQLRGGNDAH